MLAFFRRILRNWWVGAILALVALAIVVTGVGTPGGGGGLFGGAGGGAGAGGEAIAKMKGGVVGSEEALRRAQQMFQEARQQDPSLTLAGFVAQGGADAAVRGLVTSRAIEAWAARNHMRPSERQIDGEIASISAFNGPDGKFDRRTFLALLAQRRISEAELRQGIAGDIVRRQLLSPVAGGVRTPQPLVDAFARALLEKRTGSIASIPAAALPAGPEPGEAAVQAYYRRNVARYSLPERRVIRYAPIGLEQVAAAAKPSDAEIAAYFRTHAADYAAREERSFSRIVFPAEAGARAFVAKVRGGTGFADAAKAAGFSTADTTLGKQTRAQLAALGSPQLADAAYTLPQGAVTDPVKAPLGWFVLRADQVTGVPARTLDQARPEIALLLARQKGEAALGDLVAKAQSAIDGGATFDDVVKANGLAPAVTPPLVASGLAPADQAFRPAPVVRTLLKPAFDASADDDATIETLGQDRFALLKVAQIVPAAPEPLAAVRVAVMRDLQLEAALTRTKAVAAAVAAKVNGGTPFAAALAGAGVKIDPPKAVTVRQYDLMQLEQQQRRPAPPAVTALFRLAPGKARAVAAPGGVGWNVVHLEKADPAPAGEVAPLAAISRREFDQAFATEIAEEFANALLKAAGVEENRAAIARLKARLTGERRGGGVNREAAAAALGAGRPGLVWQRQLADTDTPVAAALALMEPGRGDFLLESVEGGSTRGRYSLLGLAPDLVFRASGTQAEANRRWLQDRAAFEPLAEPPLAALRRLVGEIAMTVPAELPGALACLVGYFAYETVGLVERLPRPASNPLDLPDMLFVRPTLILVFDRLSDELFLVAPVWPDDPTPIADRLDAAAERIESAAARLAARTALPRVPVDAIEVAAEPQLPPGRYGAMVARAKDYIVAGDIFQVVLAQRFTTSFPLPPFDLYRALRRINPSPFLYHLDLPGFALTGSSPEILVRARGGEVTIRPIAGTRPRGRTAAEDAARREELLADPKERAEHLMLLDLGRNDVGRVASTGSVHVTESYGVELYSHVMHIVSNVTGRLHPEKDALDALFAGFPAGTVSGAPKVRACEIIAELEPETRGAYAGGVGYFSPDGSMDSCIVLRTAVVKDGMMHVQAGAGIVADSDAQAEQRECEAKAGALFAAAREALARAGEAGFGQ